MWTRDDQPTSAVAGDEAPAGVLDFTALFERYHQEVYRLCLGMLDDPGEAEDATQEVFLRVHRALASYDAQRAGTRTWISHITLNYCRTLLRRRKVLDLALRLLGRTPETYETTHRSDLHADLSLALQILDHHHRSVMLLRYYLDFSCAEIAQVLEISEGTVHSRLHTARQRMRAALTSNDVSND